MILKWEGATEKWTRGWVYKNFWRVEKILLSEQDAVQQCAWLYAYCCHKYGDVVDKPGWMMALYKRAVTNHWHTLSRKQTELAEAISDEMVEMHVGHEIDYEATIDFDFTRANPMLLELPHIGSVTVWESASAELKMVLTMLANSPTEMLQIMLDETCPDLNRRWCRICKLKSEPDLVGELRMLLTE